MTTTTPRATPESILSFWFGNEYEASEAGEAKDFWFTKSDTTDAYIREHFGNTVKAARRGECDAWEKTPHGRLALIIVLDQFPRNIYRDTPNAFSSDTQALALAQEGIMAGVDQELTGHERVFFYMPFMHSERIEDQETSVKLFDQLEREGVWSASWAHKHKDVIDQFGRYPHRNAIVGRISTPEELEYLSKPGAGF